MDTEIARIEGRMERIIHYLESTASEQRDNRSKDELNHVIM